MTNVEARDIQCVIAPVANGVVYGLGTHIHPRLASDVAFAFQD